MDEPEEREPIPEEQTERIAERIRAELGEDFAGYPVRVDAGERGRVWVALEGAEGDDDARRVTAERLDEHLGELEQTDRGVSFRLSAAPNEGNLVLVCECFTDPAESL